MWVHRKVSQHCCANHVSGHRLKAGQMLGKGQWGYVILIRGGFGGWVLWILFSTSASPCRGKTAIGSISLRLSAFSLLVSLFPVFTRSRVTASAYCVVFIQQGIRHVKYDLCFCDMFALVHMSLLNTVRTVGYKPPQVNWEIMLFHWSSNFFMMFFN